jgi:prefoldin subunit 5
MTGPLARKIAELTEQRDAARDGAKALAATLHEVNMQIVEVTGSEDCIEEDGDGDWDAVCERLQELKGIREQRDQLAAANVELRNELHSLLNRADRYAGTLAEIHAWHWWHVGRACDSRWPACEAARWKAEQDAVARFIEERRRGG